MPILLLEQFTSLVSVPEHCTSSSQMGPVPQPKKAEEWAIAPTTNVQHTVTKCNEQEYVQGKL